MTDLPARAEEEQSAGFSGAVHATTVAIEDRAVLIRGASGAGKSDLALRLIDRGATLVSDDYTQVAARDGRVLAAAAPNIVGLIEVRGLGPVAMPHVAEAPVALIVELTEPSGPAPERYPPEGMTARLCGVDVPLLHLRGLEASAPIKVELALKGPPRQGTTP